MVQFDEDKHNRRLKELLEKEEEDLAQTLSGKYGIEYLDLSQVSINPDALRIIKEAEAKEARVAAFDIINKKIHVAAQSPQNEKTLHLLKELEERGYQPTVYMVSSKSLDRAWNRYSEVAFASEVKAGVLDISNEEIQNFVKKVRTIGDAKVLIEEVLKLKKGFRISKILEIILAGALSMNASDVHFEPESTYTRLRYRLDGVLTDVLNFDLETFSLLLSRMKLLSGLKINVKDIAQDGRFSIKIDTTEIEIRTSVLPGAYSESIVLRVLNPEAISVPMEELGIGKVLYEILDREIKKPNGMLLTTGPTGSGKTTTLYAFLKKIHAPGIKIITIEDPIEYHLPGIVQTQAEDKYTFAEGLRSALRQDPDVIMVGEIRDSETAKIAINAGLTGHLVFSTLHTNNAAGAFPRLVDLDIDPKVISSAINAVMAQRLIRVLCRACAKEVPLTDEEKSFVKKVLTGVRFDNDEKVQMDRAWEPVGCPECNNLGYKGRVGVFEAIVVDESIDKLIRESPSEREIEKIAISQGIPSMLQDGVIKVLKGVTSLEELRRVVDLKE